MYNNYNLLICLGRTSSSMDETIFIQALPDPSVPKPADEDLPKVPFESLNNLPF